MNAKTKKARNEKNQPLTITVTPEELAMLDQAVELFAKAYGVRLPRASVASTCFGDGLKELLAKLA